MRAFRVLSLAAFTVFTASAVAQPLEPLDADVEDIVYGIWVQAGGSLGETLYEADFTEALQRCAFSMFTLEDPRLRALFPSTDHARGDLSIFPYEDGALLALADGAYPAPKKMSAQQLRTDTSLMLRLVSDAFWDVDRRNWVEINFTRLNWGDVVVSETNSGARRYKMLMVMRPSGETGLYVKCEE
ncbi:MAG: hypothetical protein RJB62_313 [Pseudomonadota bacterium]